MTTGSKKPKQAYASLRKGVGNRDPKVLEAHLQVSKDLLKEWPRLRLEKVAVMERQKVAKGKDSEDLKKPELAILVAQEKLMTSDTVEELGNLKANTVNVEWMRDEMANDEAIAKRISAQISELEVELRAPERIVVLDDAVATKAIEGK